MVIFVPGSRFANFQLEAKVGLGQFLDVNIPILMMQVFHPLRLLPMAQAKINSLRLQYPSDLRQHFLNIDFAIAANDRIEQRLV